MEGTSSADLGLHPDLSVMRANDLFGDRQAQTRTPLGTFPHLRKRLEDLLQVFRFDPRTGIPDTHMDPAVLPPCPDHDIPAFAVLNGIGHQVDHDLEELVPVETYFRKILPEVHDKVGCSIPREKHHAFMGLPDHFVYVMGP